MTTAVRRHVLSDGRQATCDSGGRRQASYRCVGRKVVDGKDEGCCFRVKACLQTRRGLNEWKITVVQDEHVNCFPASSGRKRGVGVQDVLDLGIKIVEGNPGISGPALGNSIRAETGLSVDPSLSRRLKRAALDSTMVGVEEGFKLIGSYLQVLSSGSPQTVTDIKWDKDGRFDRLFVMLGQAARAASTAVLQVFSMDVCHLSDNGNGVMCLLTIKDAENRVRIVAMTVAAGDTSDVYEYTLRNASRNPEMASFLNKSSTSYFVDGDESSQEGVPDVVPLAERRRCLRHLCATLKPELGSECRSLVFDAARAPNEGAFTFFMDQAKRRRPVPCAKLLEYPREEWAYHAGRRNLVGDQVTSNLSGEASSVVAKLRSLPMYDLIKGMVDHMCEELDEASRLSQDIPDAVWTPFADSRYDTEYRESISLIAKVASSGVYNVCPLGNPRLECRVELSWPSPDRTRILRCSCGYHQCWDLPCRHMLAVCSLTGTLGRSRGLIGSRYKLDVYRASAFTPELAVRTPIFGDLVPEASHKPPIAVEQAGRPRRGRKRKNPIPGAEERAAASRSDTPARGTSRGDDDGRRAAPEPRPGSPSREGGASSG